MKKTLTLVTTILTTMILSAVPTLADTRITSIDTFRAENTYIGTGVFDKTSIVNAKGGNVMVTDIETTDFINSVADTIVKSGNKVYNIKGYNINIATVDQTIFNGSAIGTYVDRKIKDIKTKCW